MVRNLISSKYQKNIFRDRIPLSQSVSSENMNTLFQRQILSFVFLSRGSAIAALTQLDFKISEFVFGVWNTLKISESKLISQGSRVNEIGNASAILSVMHSWNKIQSF